jgi:hypothetical protein
MYLSMYRCVNDRPQFGCPHSHSLTDAVFFSAGIIPGGVLCKPPRTSSSAPVLGDTLEISFADIEIDLEELLIGSMINSLFSSGISNSCRLHHSTPSNKLSLHISSSAPGISNPSPQWSRLSANPKDAPSRLGDSVVPGQQKSSRLASGQRHASRPSD